MIMMVMVVTSKTVTMEKATMKAKMMMIKSNTFRFDNHDGTEPCR
jgi:hypothetical protein